MSAIDVILKVVSAFCFFLGGFVFGGSLMQGYIYEKCRRNNAGRYVMNDDGDTVFLIGNEQPPDGFK